VGVQRLCVSPFDDVFLLVQDIEVVPESVALPHEKLPEPFEDSDAVFDFFGRQLGAHGPLTRRCSRPTRGGRLQLSTWRLSPAMRT
jgi:hypothetical protein